MRKHVRKNLIVDAEKLRELAHLEGTSESEAVRRAVDQVLWANEVVGLFEQLQQFGGIEDVFGRPPALDDEKA